MENTTDKLSFRLGFIAAKKAAKANDIRYVRRDIIIAHKTRKINKDYFDGYLTCLDMLGGTTDSHGIRYAKSIALSI